MEFHLDSDIFDIIVNKDKDVEIRLNDEKRRKLKIGDTLVFLKRSDDIESISVIVTNLVYFDSFIDVTNYYDMKRVYLDNTSKEDYINLMKRFYSDEEVYKYGVVAIEFTLD